jgi:hypothetical protein
MGKEAEPLRPGFDPELAGKRAECDGGGPVWGTKFAGRQEFTGTLTGKYVDHGDPPWRWYLMNELTARPENYEGDAVWCESDSIYLVDEPDRMLDPCAQRNVERAQQENAERRVARANRKAKEGE